MDRKMIVISDVDGCLTDGKFIYTSEGKVAKIFGAHDNDGIKLLRKNGIEVRFISADKRGFEITKKRIEDMKCELDYVPETNRANYLARYRNDERYCNGLIFFGDGLGDLAAARQNDSIYFVSPANGRPEVKGCANYVTDNIGGEGAFLDLAEHIVFEYIDDDNVMDLYQLT